MRTILYIADSSSWHNALWTEYFCQDYNVLLFSDKKDSYKKVFFDGKVRIFEYAPVMDFGNRHLNKIISIPFYLKKLKEICNEYDVDIIHCVAIYYAFLGVLIRRSRDFPFIYTLQGSEILIKARKSRLYRYMIESAFKKADVITGDSNAIVKAAADLGAPAKHSYVIQNGVRLSQFLPRRHAKEQLREMFDVKEREFLIFSPRAITDLYNIDIIIKALALLANAGFHFKAVFVFGFGDENMNSLKDLATQLGVDANIIWHGYVDHKEMPFFYQGSDLVLSIPSSDSSPKSVYEAMACKTAVLVSDLPWVRENFQPGKSIQVLNEISPRCLARQIEHFFCELSASERQVISEEAYKIVKENCSYEINMKKMEDIMLATCRDKRRMD